MCIAKKKIIHKYQLLINWSLDNNHIRNARELLERMKQVADDKEVQILEAKIEAIRKDQSAKHTKTQQDNVAAIKGKATKTEEWIEGTCYALDSATMDAAKVAILSSSIADRVLSGSNLYRLFLCGGFTMDTAKTRSIDLLVTNLDSDTSINGKQFADIINTLTMDAAKKSVSAKLLPLMK